MKPKAQKITVIIVFLLVILFGAGQFFARAPIPNGNPSVSNAPNAQPTRVIAYEASLPINAAPAVRGSCWTNSIAAPYRMDAWRCAVGNGIQDPCFQINGSTSTLLCNMNPGNPAATSSFILSLTKPLLAPEVPAAPAPNNWAWLVKLGDGTLCSPFTGTRPFSVTGEVAEYSCAPRLPGGPEWDIFGDINVSSSIWTAEVGMLSLSTSTFPPPIIASSVVPVAAVWQ